MGRHFDASPQKILEAKMRALETQFMQPVFSEIDYRLKRQTEIALGEVYKEIMQLKKDNKTFNHGQKKRSSPRQTPRSSQK